MKTFSPGARLLELMAGRDWTQTDLAEILGRPLQAVNEIIGGKKEITRETASAARRRLQHRRHVLA
jgi:HTH-type transcriptional regulator/antitoxin HigA